MTRFFYGPATNPTAPASTSSERSTAARPLSSANR